jgi:hypothetical protein
MYLQSIGATNDDAILNSWRCGRTGRALRTYPAGMHPPTLTRIVSYIAGPGLRARRCAASARRSGASLGEPQPSWLCPNGKPDEGEYSHAENDNRNRGHFDDGKPSCHAPLLAAVERPR